MASCIYLLASLSLAFLCSSEANLISNICSEAVNPSLCFQILTSDPHSRGADLRGLGLIVVKKAKAATRNTIRVIKSFNTGSTKASVELCVVTCNNAIDDLNECSRILKKFDNIRKGGLLTRGSGAIANVETCNDEFGDEPPSVKAAIKRAEDIIDVLLVIATSLS